MSERKNAKIMDYRPPSGVYGARGGGIMDEWQKAYDVVNARRPGILQLAHTLLVGDTCTAEDTERARVLVDLARELRLGSLLVRSKPEAAKEREAREKAERDAAERDAQSSVHRTALGIWSGTGGDPGPAGGRARYWLGGGDWRAAAAERAAWLKGLPPMNIKDELTPFQRAVRALGDPYTNQEICALPLDAQVWVLWAGEPDAYIYRVHETHEGRAAIGHIGALVGALAVWPLREKDK